MIFFSQGNLSLATNSIQCESQIADKLCLLQVLKEGSVTFGGHKINVSPMGKK